MTAGVGHNAPRPLNLALQGGGAHGAFTWGVLDRLLEDGRFAVGAISGCSAGAMNAVALADGYAMGGADGARETLERFWKRVADETRFSPAAASSPIDLMFGNFNLDTSPAYLFLDIATRFLSPYDVNPLNLNPLRDVLHAVIDFERVRAGPIHVVVSATNVHTGKLKVFKGGEITADAVLASACLPLLFKAVEIDGVPYWDGGYGGNPALYPLFGRKCDDILLVQINPVERRETPHTAQEILNRINEITFNASLLKELRAIEFVTRLIDEGRLQRGHYHKVRLHRIDGGAALGSLDLNASSKLNTSWAFLQQLHGAGRDAADAWLARDGGAVGVKGTVDLRQEIA